VVTGIFDEKHAPGNVPDDEIEETGDTELAHILPFALSKYSNNVEVSDARFQFAF
jgi:hypothetical protein